MLNNSICTLPLLVCEVQLQFQFLFDTHRKLFRALNINAASWREETPKTPQQDDAKSCGVYVLKVGLLFPAISTKITEKFAFKLWISKKLLKVVTSRYHNPVKGSPYRDDLYGYGPPERDTFPRSVVYRVKG